MLRFRLAGIPVEVHYSHLLSSGVLAYSFRPAGREDGGGLTPALLAYVATWVGVIFVSVLVHEMGHALAARAFGYRPSITLLWLGGNTRTQAPSDRKAPIPWHRQIWVTLAGPLAGFCLAVVCYVVLRTLGTRAQALGQGEYVLRVMVGANLFWTALNLAPIVPLDGGRICHLALARLWKAQGEVVADGIGLLVGGGMAIFGWTHGYRFTAILFGMFGMRVMATLLERLSLLRRSEARPLRPASAASLETAKEALRKGDYGRVRSLVESMLASDADPALHDEGHKLLGWVALKEGRGTQALEVFSKIRSRRLEPEALAAAFSLAGDDLKALPFWEVAFKESGQSLLLHEWAGALIRLGRIEEAAHLPGVRLAVAFQCALRVLLIRDQLARAIELARVALAKDVSPELAYDAACVFGRAGRKDEALAALMEAYRLGFRRVGDLTSEEDLASLRGDGRFVSWLEEVQKSVPS